MVANVHALKLASDRELCARAGTANGDRLDECYDALRMFKETVDVLDRL